MVTQGTYLTPTLIAEWTIPEFGKGQLPDWEVKKAADALDDTYVNLRHAYQLGVKFTCGTDAGTPFNGFDLTPAGVWFTYQTGHDSHTSLSVL